MIRFACPDCGQKLKVADSYVGRAARCTRCRAKISVPRVEPSAEFEVVSDEVAADFEVVDTPPMFPRPRPAKSTVARESPKTERRSPAPSPAPAPRPVNTPQKPEQSTVSDPTPPPDDERPRKKKKRKRPQSSGAMMPVLIGVGVVWLLFVIGTFIFPPVAIGMMVLGGMVYGAGRLFVQAHVKENEDMGTWIMCLILPTYWLFYCLGNRREMRVPLTISAIGGASVAVGLVLFLGVIVIGGRSSGLDKLAAGSDSPIENGEVDKQCHELLQRSNLGDARRWLEQTDAGRSLFGFDGASSRELLKTVYDGGAKQAVVVEVGRRRNREDARRIVVELPDDPKKAKELANHIETAVEDAEHVIAVPGQKFVLVRFDD